MRNSALVPLLFLIFTPKSFQQNGISNNNEFRIQKIENVQLGFLGDYEKSTVATHNKTVICVFNSWSMDRKNKHAKFSVADIDPSLCSHILFRLNSISEEGNGVYKIMVETSLIEEGNIYKQVTDFKLKYPSLKIFLAIGGWNEGTRKFQAISSSKASREEFAKNSLDFLRKYNFDGLDVEWQWPGVETRNGNREDIHRVNDLLSKLSSVLKAQNLGLTLTVPADTAILLNGYNLEVIYPLVDYVIIMGQDFQGFWSSTTGHHSPLHGETRSLEKTLNYFTESKFPSEKIILGIPFVGRTFLLRTEEMDKPGHSLGSASQGGFRGTFQFDDDILAYNEICFDIYHLKKNWSVYLDLEAKVPFMRDGNKWVSFDDPQSVTQKVELGIQKHLGGFAAWSIDTDDFKGSLCTPEGTKEITYPLLRSINYVLSIKTNSSNARPLEEKTESTDNSSVSRISSSLYIFSFFVINIFVFL